MTHNNSHSNRKPDGNQDLMIRITGLKKQYRLGKIGGGTLQGDLREWMEKRRDSSLSDTSKKRGTIYALDGLDLTVKKGERLGIIGRNGAGKSTLLKVLSRITAPTKGRVELYGRVASMLEVGTGFHGDMTGRENIYLNGAILGMTRAEIEEKIDDIIAFSELEDFIDTPVKRYSSGMFVKLGFSVAVHLDSEIVIMDEVLAVGDLAFQKKCLDRLSKISEEESRTVLYVSHNMNTVRRLCSRCIVVDSGRIVFDGRTEEAISVYMGTNELLPSSISFGQEYRPNDALIRLTRQFTILSQRLTEKTAPVFTPDEDAHIELDCRAEKPLQRVGFRLELWSQEGDKIASMLTGVFVDFPAGDSTLPLSIPMKHLVSGHYRADLVAFQFDEDGNEYMIDAVYPGFLFQVKTTLGGENYLDWHHKYWGDVRLHDLVPGALQRK